MCRGMTLLGVDEVRELGWISQEEDGCIVGNNIPIPTIRTKFHGEPTRIASTIVRT